jgi:hypothetical protein
VIVALVFIAWGAGRAGAQTASEGALAEARRLYDLAQYDKALAVVDPVIVSLQTQGDRQAGSVLVPALELRARARFMNGDSEGTRVDFTTLLSLAPAYTLTGKISPRIQQLFDEVRKKSIGQLRLKVVATPDERLDDVRLEIDGVVVALDGMGAMLSLPAGPRVIEARRLGYKTWKETVALAPGGVQDVTIALPRVGAVLTIATSPPGVDVALDDTIHARTEAGPLPDRYTDWPAKLGVARDLVSKPLVFDNLDRGNHRLVLTLECHKTIDRTFAAKDLKDYVETFLLPPAFATVTVNAAGRGARLYIDNDLKGQVPTTIDNVCEGTHVLEVRTAFGSHVENLTVKAGDTVTVEARPRPVVALLDVVGLPKEYRGQDPRADVARSFAATDSLVMFTPPANRVQPALKAESLEPGWLSFDTWLRPLNSSSENVQPGARQEFSRNLAKALDVQAVAELTVRPGTTTYLLSVLAAGSGQPDVFEFNIDQPGTILTTFDLLNRPLSLSKPSVGMIVADILDVPAPVVISVERGGSAEKAGIVVGDQITKIGADVVKDGAMVAAVLEKQEADSRVTLEVKDHAGAVKRVEAPVTMAPRLVAEGDQSWASNVLLLGLRAALAKAGSTGDTSVLRLNLAVALMRVKNYADALTELRAVRLPDGPGISNGTVQYLMGACHEKLGQPAEAGRAFGAAASMDGQLTDGGPAIKDLAKIKLAELRKGTVS